MKRFLLSLIFFSALSFAFANDTYFSMAAGQLIPKKEIDTEVEMKEEIINIVQLQKKEPLFRKLIYSLFGFL